MRSAASPLTTYLPRNLQLEAKGGIVRTSVWTARMDRLDSRSFKVSFSLAAENTRRCSRAEGDPMRGRLVGSTCALLVASATLVGAGWWSYRLDLGANTSGCFLESDTTNNTAWATLRIRTGRVNVLSRGGGV
jgi:hypothetical protein